MNFNRNQLKRKVLASLSEALENCQNLEHTNGTTQTTTNMLNAKFDNADKMHGSEEEVNRTTRYLHQKQVSEQARAIIEATSSKDSEYYAELATIAGLTHDIGHCTYGHDGEAKIDGFTQSFNSVLSDSQKSKIAEFRRVYFSDRGESVKNAQNFADGSSLSYEEQQAWQNELIGQENKGNTYIFDHGEESALAIVNICETEKEAVINELKEFASVQEIESIFSEVQNDLVQCALMHSRPAFNKSNPASEAVAIADSVAFIQDDLDQAILASRISMENRGKNQSKLGAVSLCENYRTESSGKMKKTLEDELGIGDKSIEEYFELTATQGTFENFLNLSTDDRKKAVTSEIANRYKANGSKGAIQNGKHLDDLIWYAGKISTKDSNSKFAEQQKDLLVRAGYVEGSNDKWSKLCAQVIAKMDGKNPQDDRSTTVNKVKALLELKYKIDFPVNYNCYCINQAVISNKLIYGKNLGNNTTKDGASTKFMLLKLYKGFIKDYKSEAQNAYDEKAVTERKDGQGITKEQKATESCTFAEFFEQMRQTPEFKKLKQAISSDKEFRGLSTTNFDAGMSEQECDAEVFRRLGFHLNGVPGEGKSQGILDHYSPVQLIAKMVEGMTNEFSRTYTKSLNQGMTLQDFKEQGLLDIANQEDLETQKVDGRHLTPQDLMGLGYSKEEIEKLQGTFENGKKFTKEAKWNNDLKVEERFDAIEFGVSQFDKDMRMQFDSLVTETSDLNFRKIRQAFDRVDDLINNKKKFGALTLEEQEKLKSYRHKFAVEISKKIEKANSSVEMESEQSNANQTDLVETTKPFIENAEELLQELETGNFSKEPDYYLDNILYLMDDLEEKPGTTGKRKVKREMAGKLRRKLGEIVRQIQNEMKNTRASGQKGLSQSLAAVKEA